MSCQFLLIAVFFLIALFYSTVGLGGGSAYVSVLVLAGIPKEQLPVIALGCNIIVSSQAFVEFYRAGHFKWRLFLPFGIPSVFFAAFGGRLNVSNDIFYGILAAALITAALRLLFFNAPKGSNKKPEKIGSVNPHTKIIGVGVKKYILCVIIGAALGLLAGITGIGGGIYLMPVIIIAGFGAPKEASAAASLFVLVNSVFGLLGRYSAGSLELTNFLPFAAVVFAGGLIGSRFGARRLKSEIVQKITAIVMLIAAIKLVMNKLL